MGQDGWLSRWYNYLKQATEQANKPIAYRHDTPQLLQAAGFVDIAEQVIQVPLCPTSRDDPRWSLSSYHQLCYDECYGLEALSLAHFSRLWGWSLADILRLTGAARTEVRTRAIHNYNNMFVKTLSDVDVRGGANKANRHIWTARRPG